MDMSSPQDKVRASQLLYTVLTRLLVNLDTEEGKVQEWFELTFAKEVLSKLIAKVPDMYCCSYAVETINECFVTTNAHNQQLM